VNDDTYVRDILVVALIGFVGIIAMAVIGQQCGEKEGFASGYIQCLQDIKHGNPPAYVLVEQPDGTTKWESNKEKGK
jgi:hypothetical protein